MYKFYFNDCLPLNKTEHEIILCFTKVLPEYRNIKNKYLLDIDGIVTYKLPGKTILNENGFSLKNCIEAIPNDKKELKNYAFSIFRKYPVEEYFSIENEEDLIDSNYYISINNSSYNALNLKIIQENEGILFTLGLHNELKKNYLTITDNDNNEFIVLNLFGEGNNTNYIDRKIQELITAKAGAFEKLLFVMGKCVFNERFKKTFESLEHSVQLAIINRFTTARNRHGITPFFAEKEGYLIKDVTPPKENTIKVFELKVYEPVACRIYFYETSEKVYLGLLENKPDKKMQDHHIKNATSIIKQLYLI